MRKSKNNKQHINTALKIFEEFRKWNLKQKNPITLKEAIRMSRDMRSENML